MIRAMLGACLAAALLPAAARAQDQDPVPVPDQTPIASDSDGAWLARRPELGDPRPFELPHIETVVLENGLSISFIPYGLAPKTTISVHVQTGNLDEGEDTWLADLTAELMREGAGGRTGAEIAEAAADMGGALSVNVGAHVSQFGLSVLSERAGDAAALLGDILTAPDFPEAELPRVRDNLLRDLSVTLAQPGAQAIAAFAEALYGPDHPYGRTFPAPEQLSAYTLAQVRDFHAEHYGAARTRIYVAGRYEREPLEAALRAALIDWAPGPEPLVLPARARAEPRVILVDRPGAPQSTILLGLPVFGAADARDIPLQVANAMLGGSFTSRITQNIREDKGYTYSPRSALTYQHRDAYWSFRADIATEHTGAALDEVFREIALLREEAPQDDETERTRAYVAGSFVLQSASPSGLIARIAFRDFHGLPPDYLDDFVPTALETDSETVRALAADFINPARMTMVVVGDLETVVPQLESVAALDGIPLERPDDEEDPDAPDTP